MIPRAVNRMPVIPLGHHGQQGWSYKRSDGSTILRYKFSDSNALTLESGNKISACVDLSNHSRDGAQTTDGYRPIYTVSKISDQPAAVFDGTDDFILIPDVPAAPVHLIFVARFNDPTNAAESHTLLDGATSGQRWWFRKRADAANNLRISTSNGAVTGSIAMDANWHIFAVTVYTTSTRIIIDGVLDGAGAITSGDDPTGLRLGIDANDTNAFDGDIADFIVITGVNYELLNRICFQLKAEYDGALKWKTYYPGL